MKGTMKATLEFDLTEEHEEFRDCMQAGKMSGALSEIGNQVFRPARKHGFSDAALNALIEKNEDAEEIIGMLESKFYEILKEYGVEL